MVPRTRALFLSRLIELHCLLVGLSTTSHKQLAEGVTGRLQHSSLTLLLGFITLGASLAMVLADNLCCRGPLAPSVYPWAGPLSAFLLQLRSCVNFALDIFLTYAGFTSNPHLFSHDHRSSIL